VIYPEHRLCAELEYQGNIGGRAQVQIYFTGGNENFLASLMDGKHQLEVMHVSYY